MAQKLKIDFDNLKKISVLCVEDQEFILQQLALILQLKVKEVYTAKDGVEGLKIFKEKKPDIVVTDIEMPELNGLGLTKQIKKINNSTPVIITTAYNDTSSLLGAFDAGADNFITKPVDMNNLFFLLSKYAGILRQKNKLIALQKRMESIYNSMGEGLFVINTKGELLYSNYAAINLTGISLTKGKRYNIKEIFDNNSQKNSCNICDMLMEKTINKLEPFISENVVFKTEYNNESINVTLVSTPLIEEGEVKGVVLIFRDITEEIKRNLRLQMMMKAMESNSVSIVVLDLNGKIIEINKAFLELSKENNIENIIGKSDLDYLQVNPRGITPFNSVIRNGKWVGELELNQKDGGVCPVEAFYLLLLEDDGTPSQVLLSLNDVTERKQATEALLKAKSQEIELYKYRERYHSLQQENAFKKQSRIIKDDLANKRILNYFIESYFKPLDVLSGDIYGSIDGGEDRYVFYIIDAMGKGLSASVTSTQSSSFINHAFETAFKKDDFSFKSTVASYISYIKKLLLDDEMLCVIFVYVNPENETIEVANYGMPPLMYQTENGEVLQISSNNPPVMKFFNTDNIYVRKYTDIIKIMIYSDGLDEHLTIDGKLYINELKDDFKNAISKKDFFKTFKSKINQLTDDITAIFLFKISIKPVERFEIDFNMENLNIEKHIKKIIGFLAKYNVPQERISQINLCLIELIMNAVEHGNLGVSFNKKQKMVENGGYEQHLNELSKKHENINKKVNIKVEYYKTSESSDFVLIKIKDEGHGFNSSEVFKKLNFSDDIIRYHGRGIAMSQLITDGIFYNKKGNKVTILIFNK